jgi:hypothetical protein
MVGVIIEVKESNTHFIVLGELTLSINRHEFVAQSFMSYFGVSMATHLSVIF